MSHSQPLAGFTVVEIGHSVAAPYTGFILASLGAELIKVENPEGGDAARGWGPPFFAGSAPHFTAFNRDKQSVAVDLRDPRQCWESGRPACGQPTLRWCTARSVHSGIRAPWRASRATTR
jgi:hypothetical protein